MVDYSNVVIKPVHFNNDSVFGAVIKKYFDIAKITYGDSSKIKKGESSLSRRTYTLTRPSKITSAKLIEWSKILDADLTIEFLKDGESSFVKNFNYQFCVKKALKQLLDNVELKELHELSTKNNVNVYELIRYRNSLNSRQREVTTSRLNSICHGFNVDWVITFRKDNTMVVLTSREYYSKYSYETE